MEDENKQYTFDRVVRMVLSALALIGILLLARFLSDVLLPFAAAVVLAYWINPLVTAFEKKTKRRGLAVGITLALIGILGLAMIVIVVPLTLSQGQRFGQNLQHLQEDLSLGNQDESPVAPRNATTRPAIPAAESPAEPSDAIETAAALDATPRSATGWAELQAALTQYRLSAKSDFTRKQRLEQLRLAVRGTYIGDLLEQLITYTQTERFNEVLVDLGKRMALGGWSIFTSALNLILGLAGLIIVLLYLVFLLVDFPEYARTWKTFLPPKYREGITEFLGEFNVVLRRYFRGQALVAGAMAVLFTIGFTVIGLPMAVPLGLLIGLLNMVPYLQTIGLIPATLLAGLRALETDATFTGSILLTLAVFAVAQVIQDALITPRFVGKATGLKPVAIMLGICVWGKLLGFLGVIVAIPLTCLGIAYYRRFVLLPADDRSGSAGDGSGA